MENLPVKIAPVHRIDPRLLAAGREWTAAVLAERGARMMGETKDVQRAALGALMEAQDRLMGMFAACEAS